jgi:ABC-type uncharacterized transport system permease subunit
MQVKRFTRLVRPLSNLMNLRRNKFNIKLLYDLLYGPVVLLNCVLLATKADISPSKSGSLSLKSFVFAHPRN